MESATEDEITFFSSLDINCHANITEERRDALLMKLGKVTGLLRDETYRARFPSVVVQQLTLLVTCDQHIDIVCEIFRIMRNASAGNCDGTMMKHDWDPSVRACCSFVKHHQRSEEEPHKAAIRCGLQFLVNLLNSRPRLGNIVWGNLKEFLTELWKNEDVKIREFSLAVFHGILRTSDEAVGDLFRDLTGNPAVGELISLAHGGSQFGVFAVHLLLEKDFLRLFYEKLDVSTRISLVQLAEEQLRENQSADVEALTQNIEYLSEKFIASADVILQTCEQSSVEFLEPEEVCALLQLLAAASSLDRYRLEMQTNKHLLMATTDLLRSIHSLGKSGSNAFSMLSDLSSFGSLSETDENAIQSHPVFGFKRSLVRLLANLCWKKKENQDLVRNEDAIPVLLECSNLDARNPFIQQYAVLALKSLCQGNVENQAAIASMTRRGVVQPAVLEQLGMSVEDTPTGLRLKPN